MFLKFTKNTTSNTSGSGGSSESSSEPRGSISHSIENGSGLASKIRGINNCNVALPSDYDSGPLSQQFEVGKLTATGGPGNAWKIYEGYRKSDAQEVSVFVFEKKLAEKLHKSRKKETLSDVLRQGIKQLEKYRHQRLLQIIAGPEETNDTLTFCSEPVYGSLANIITSVEENEKDKEKISTHKDYNFLEVELKYGLLQIAESLSFLHYTCNVIHRNVTPNSIYVTKKGTWKLAGLEFAEYFKENEGEDAFVVQPWNTKASKLTQPELDFLAPEVHSHSKCTYLGDMFSLGMVIFSIFNNGKSLVEANYSTSTYLKQIEAIEENVNKLLPKLPAGIQEAAVRLASKDPKQRPTSQLLALIKFFSDPIVSCLQSLDSIDMKDPNQKSHFYRTTLVETLPLIPKKLWFLHLWPTLQQEMKTQEALAAALQPILKLVAEISSEEYENIVLPHFRSVFTIPKSIQATVTLLENMDIILRKTPEEDIETDILPIIYAGLESNTLQVQVAAIMAATSASESLETEKVRKRLLPRLKQIYETNSSDVPMTLTVLSCYERILDKIGRTTVIDEVLPILYDIKMQDPEIMVKVVNIYRLMLSDKNFGLSVNQIANRVLPSLIPLTVFPTLHLEQFSFLMLTIQEMLEMIDRHQKRHLKLGNLNLASPGSGEKRMLRHQLSSDSMTFSPFTLIPNVRIQDSKMSSSAEDFLSRRGSASAGPSSPDSNLLRVQSGFIGRRLSDNELMMPPKIRIAHSAASSPGDNSVSLPIRRHSSICSERRGSTVANLSNLSPPSGPTIASNSRSVPMLLTPGNGSNVSSRRPSTCSIGSYGGLDSRRSSIASIGSPLSTPTFKAARRPSTFAMDNSNTNLLQTLSSGVCQLFTGK